MPAIEQLEEVDSPTTDAELLAIIREARAHARRRRLRFVGATVGALTLLGAGWWGFGGGGDSLFGSSEPDAPATASSNGASQSADACPSGPGARHLYVRDHFGRTCTLQITATLPQGWHQNGSQTDGMPDVGNLSTPGLAGAAVAFSDFEPPARAGLTPPRPAPGGISLALYHNADESNDPGSGRYAERPLTPEDFRAQPLGHTLRATADIYRDGWHLSIGVEAGAPLSREGITEANSLLDSITVSESLQPFPRPWSS